MLRAWSNFAYLSITTRKFLLTKSMNGEVLLLKRASQQTNRKDPKIRDRKKTVKIKTEKIVKQKLIHHLIYKLNSPLMNTYKRAMDEQDILQEKTCYRRFSSTW